MVSFLDDLEMGLCLRVNALSRSDYLRNFFRLISRLGDWPAYVIGAYLCAQIGTTPPTLFVFQAALTCCFGLLTYKVLKSRLIRERPYITHCDIKCGTAPLDRYSFPSGHTLHATSFTILFWAHCPGSIWIMAPFALLVAASRIVLGLHYPSDVLAGAVLGAAIAQTSLQFAG